MPARCSWAYAGGAVETLPDGVGVEDSSSAKGRLFNETGGTRYPAIRDPNLWVVNSLQPPPPPPAP